MADEIKRVYTLDIKGAESMDALKKSVTELNAQLAELDKTSKEYLDTLTKLEEAQKALSSAMGGEIAQAAKDISQGFDSVKSSVSGLSDTFNPENMGATTVKELRAEIASLKDALVQLSPDTDQYRAVVSQLVQDQTKLKEVMNAGKQEITSAAGSYNALAAEMSALKQAWKSTTDEAERNTIGQRINEINTQLKEMDASIGNNQRKVGSYVDAIKEAGVGFQSLRSELKDLKEAMQQLDPASDAYAEAFSRAAQITHDLAEQQEMLKYSSPDVGDQLSNIRGIATNLAAGYGALNAAMGLFGEENEDVKEAMLKVQQVMALIQGMQGMDGLIKRTQGLSTAMQAWTKTQQAAAAATKAQAVASAQDATAKGAEAAATAGAVAPQMALNAAMAANPIGVILTAIGALIAIFMVFKEKIKELIGGNEQMSKAFEKVKAVLAGVGNVIKKSVINPIKMAIIPIKTLGKVMVDVFKGDWSAIGDDIKAGAEEMKDTVVDSINVIGQFKEGYDKKTAEQNEARRKAEAAAREKDLDDQIKDNEARYGSDWKYTEDAKKLYDEMFASRMAQYAEDSEEYKEAQRDKMSYDREYEKKKTEEAEKAEKERQAAAKKAAEEYKKEREKELKDFQSAFNKYIPSGVTIQFNIEESRKKWKKGLDEFKAYVKKEYKGIVSDTDKLASEMWKAFKADEGKEMTKGPMLEYQKSLKEMADSAGKILNDMQAKSARKAFEGLIPKDEALDAWDAMYELMSNDLTKTVEMTAKAAKDVKNIYEEQFAYITDEKERQNAVNKALLDDPFYKQLLEKQEALIKERTKLELDNLKTKSDIMKQDYDLQVKGIDDLYTANSRFYERMAALEESKVGFGTWRTEAMIEAELEEQLYNERMAQLESLKTMYEQMVNDQTLSAEERLAAQKELSETIMAMEDAELAHTISVSNRKKEAVKAWMDGVKSAADGIGNILGTVAQAWEDNINQEVEAGKISQEEGEKKFENVKKVQKAQALINAFGSAVGAYNSMASIPYVGPILGAVAAAAALAAGMVQYKAIDSTTLNGGAASAPSAGASNAMVLPSVMAEEPTYTQNITGQQDIDELKSAFSNQRVYVVESDIQNATDKSNKRKTEVTW